MSTCVMVALISLAKGFATSCGGEVASIIVRRIRELWSRRSSSSSSESSSIPDSPEKLVGLDHHIEELKRRLFTENVKKLGVSAMGGSGKTTLAAALCRDPEVKEHFGNKIIFQKVSETPDIEKILENIWVGITGSKPESNFRPIPDARRRLKEWLSNEEPQNILVVLDDVWLEDAKLEELLFEAEGYKTVVTARHSFRCLDDTYDLPLLGEKDALTLFCHEAFGQENIPDEGYNEALVKEVAGKCQGLPLALMVIGRSLHNERDNTYWEHARDKLSEGGPIDRAHEEEVLKLLAVSIDRLDNDMKQCFLDLILFPAVKEIHVDTVFDIWIYVHNLSPSHARRNLIELERRGLLSLVNHDTGDHLGISDGSTRELYIVQHDTLRNLAIYWADNNQPDYIRKRLRLYPLCSWERHDNIEDAEIIAIRTDPRNANQWPRLKFPRAQGLVLIFTGNECLLPTCLRTMPELKVLIIINQNSVRTKLDGMSVFGSLTKLKSLRLEKLNVPPLQHHCQSFENLKKLSLCLCRGDQEELDIQVCSVLLTLEEINIDCCADIKKLPDGICNLTSLKTLTITNCHDLQMIPNNIGELAGSLEKLTLYACPTLQVLPNSICELEKLKLLDISKCQLLKMLPSRVGNLHNLECLSMNECEKIKKLPASAKGLTSLRRLICDKQLENQCLSLQESIPDLKITFAEPKHDLGWLDR